MKGTSAVTQGRSRLPKRNSNRENKTCSDWKFGGNAESEAPFVTMLAFLSLKMHVHFTGECANARYSRNVNSGEANFDEENLRRGAGVLAQFTIIVDEMQGKH